MTTIVDLSGKRGLVAAADVRRRLSAQGNFYREDRVVENYNLMGQVKAALDSSVRDIATDLADKKIRAHAILTGPLKTRAASGIDRFDEQLDQVRARMPASRLATIEEIGRVAAILVSDAAAPLTGFVVYADNGSHTVA